MIFHHNQVEKEEINFYQNLQVYKFYHKQMPYRERVYKKNCKIMFLEQFLKESFY